MYEAEVIADSTAYGVRLTTLQVVMPRFILAEFNTHRMLSRNSASSRAIPVKTRVAQVREAPFVPEAFTKNQRGMSAVDGVDEHTQRLARRDWLHAAGAAAVYGESLAEHEVHKQHANRVMEPFVWHTVVVTATEWANFFALRISKFAQPEMRKTAELMKAAMNASTPRELKAGEWHLPYVDYDAANLFRNVAGDGLLKISVARCAAVSYERQEAEKTIEQYTALHDGLLTNRHMSPFEHQAQVVAPYGGALLNEGAHVRMAAGDFSLLHWDRPFAAQYNRRGDDYAFAGDFCGNFRAPWLQYRKMLPGEAVSPGDSV